MNFVKSLFLDLYTRVIVHYKPTLLGIAAACGIEAIDHFTTLLQSVPPGAAQIAASLALAIGALTKQKLQTVVDDASKPAP